MIVASKLSLSRSGLRSCCFWPDACVLLVVTVLEPAAIPDIVPMFPSEGEVEAAPQLHLDDKAPRYYDSEDYGDQQNTQLSPAEAARQKKLATSAKKTAAKEEAAAAKAEAASAKKLAAEEKKAEKLAAKEAEKQARQTEKAVNAALKVSITTGKGNSAAAEIEIDEAKVAFKQKDWHTAQERLDSALALLNVRRRGDTDFQETSADTQQQQRLAVELPPGMPARNRRASIGFDENGGEQGSSKLANQPQQSQLATPAGIGGPIQLSPAEARRQKQKAASPAAAVTPRLPPTVPEVSDASKRGSPELTLEVANSLSNNVGQERHDGDVGGRTRARTVEEQDEHDRAEKIVERAMESHLTWAQLDAATTSAARLLEISQHEWDHGEEDEAQEVTSSSSAGGEEEEEEEGDGHSHKQASAALEGAMERHARWSDLTRTEKEAATLIGFDQKEVCAPTYHFG